MIIPGILEKDFKNVISKVNQIKDSAKTIQIDIADGKLVDGETFLDITQIEALEFHNFEIHLMVVNPLDFLNSKLKNVNSIVAHLESSNTTEFVKKAKSLGYRTGICLNPGTSLENLGNLMDEVDFVQLMTVVPGGQGRVFQNGVLNKISILRKAAPRVEIQVDGGINETTLFAIIEAGADSAVIGSHIFGAENPSKALKDFEKLARDEFMKREGHKPKEIRRIAFLGGATFNPEDETFKDAYEVAKLLAQNGYEVMNGGGPGVMRASTMGAHDGGGKVTVVTYHPAYKHKNYEGVDPFNFYDDEIMTVDYFDRTKVMLQNSDAHIVFKGGTGTISEFGMTWASSRIHEGHHKPIVLYGQFWHKILKVFDETMTMREGELELVTVLTSPKEVLEFIRSL